MSWLRRPGRSPRTSSDPPATGCRPSSIRRNVDLPAPLGPSTATTWPPAIVTSRPPKSTRPATRAETPAATTVGESAEVMRLRAGAGPGEEAEGADHEGGHGHEHQPVGRR